MSDQNMKQQNLLMTEFDLLTTGGATQMVKAIIPYLAPDEQKMLGLMVRIWELVGTIKYYSCGKPPLCHNIPGINTSNGINTEMINNIKKYCTPENQKLIDTLLNFMNAREMMKLMNSFDSSGIFGTEKNDCNTDSFCDGDCDNCEHACKNCDESTNNSDNIASNSIGRLLGMFNQSSIMNAGQVSLYQEYMNQLNNDFSEACDE